MEICRSRFIFPKIWSKDWTADQIIWYSAVIKTYIHDQRKYIYISNDDNYRHWNDCTITKYTKRSEERRVDDGSILSSHFVRKRNTRNYGYNWCQDEHRSWCIILKISWILQNVIYTDISYYTSLGKNKRSQWSTKSKAYSVDNRLTIMTKYNYSCQYISTMLNRTKERKLKIEVDESYFDLIGRILDKSRKMINS